MADKNIQEGDNVEWKWGNGKPSGVVEEVQTEGKLEIESKGKKVHKNASPENPAVHVGRDGNDVVKRMSELEKTGESEDKAQQDVEGEDAEAGDGGDNAVENGEEEKAKTRSETTKEGKEADVGDKRKRTVGGVEDGLDAEKMKEKDEEEKVAEKATGKKAKKAKVDKTKPAQKKRNGSCQKKAETAGTRGKRRLVANPKKGSETKDTDGDVDAEVQDETAEDVPAEGEVEGAKVRN